MRKKPAYLSFNDKIKIAEMLKTNPELRYKTIAKQFNVESSTVSYFAIHHLNMRKHKEEHKLKPDKILHEKLSAIAFANLLSEEDKIFITNILESIKKVDVRIKYLIEIYEDKLK